MKRSRQRGQGLIEYLLIIAVILATIALVAPLLGNAVGRLYNSGEDKVNQSSDLINNTAMGNALTW